MIHIPPWKAFIILGICLLGLIFAAPNVLSPETVAKLPEILRPVNLGLDLRGGSHLMLEVDVKAGLQDRLNFLVDSVRGTLRKEKIGYVGLGIKGDAITFTLRDPLQLGQVKRLMAKAERELEYSDDGAQEVSLRFSEAAISERTKMMLDQSIEIVRRRIDEFGTTEPNIQQQGTDRIVVQLPGVDDPGRVKQLIGKTAKMTLRLVHQDSASLIASGKVPAGSEVLMGSEGERYVVNKQILVTGENLVGASPGFDEYNRPEVRFTLDAFGARKFADATTKNLKRQLAIILDNRVLSAPVISTPITAGDGRISGQFTLQQVQDLALLMRAGALPAPLTPIQEQTVGPDLGADSIAAGQMATGIAIVLVAIFMILAYSFFGIVANIALIFNIILLMGSLSLLQATLTLPGIAGIALTIGMAVDANVLIYERIKEELRKGLKPIAAIDIGYAKAMATIVDSNLTTLIGGGLLFSFGSGSIRGFAVTLSLGIVISMFTAISLNRLIVLYWYRWRRPKELPL